MSSLLLLQHVLVLLLLRTASVDCVHCLSSECCTHDAWHKCHVATLFIVSSRVLYRMFFVVLGVLVAGDLKHEYAQSAWGFLFRGPPGCCVCRACIMAIDAPLTIIVVAGWVSLWYSQRPHDAFVAFVGEAALWLCHGSPCRIRRTLVSWAFWCFTIMESITSIVISDGFNCAHRNWQWRRCLLSLVATVPTSSDACIVFTARIFNSLITFETELWLD